jgi:RHS repeat-associated protein
MWQTTNSTTEWLQSKHIYLGEDRVATKFNSEGNPNTLAEERRVYYYHTDHLGSAQTITNYMGALHERLEYTPYGELWIDWQSNEAIDSTPFRFTGKERDRETGLYYYGARYLDPKTSRWLSADPAMHQGDFIPSASDRNKNLPNGGIYNYINFHVFNYSNNNPVKYNDPDGRQPRGTHQPGRNGEMFPMNDRVFRPPPQANTPSARNNASTALLQDRILMGTRDYLPGAGPCYMMSLLGIAQTVAGKNLTDDELQGLITSFRTGDNPVIGQQGWLVNDSRYGASIIEAGLKILDPDNNYSVNIAAAADPGYDTIRKNATASLIQVPGHWQEGNSNGNFVWDPLHGTEQKYNSIEQIRYVEVKRNNE